MSLLERNQVKSEGDVGSFPMKGGDMAALMRDDLRSQQNQKGVGLGLESKVFGSSHVDRRSDWDSNPTNIRPHY
jgi:hypothetical protein